MHAQGAGRANHIFALPKFNMCPFSTIQGYHDCMNTHERMGCILWTHFIAARVLRHRRREPTLQKPYIYFRAIEPPCSPIPKCAARPSVGQNPAFLAPPTLCLHGGNPTRFPSPWEAHSQSRSAYQSSRIPLTAAIVLRPSSTIAS